MRWKQALGGLLAGVTVLLIFPLYVVPDVPHNDALAHVLAGVALTLFASAIIPRRDDLILLAVFLVGVIWEPAEAYWFGENVLEWMIREDTLFDIALVFAGSVLTLIGIGRYE